jgi:hypothetical protein
MDQGLIDEFRFLLFAKLLKEEINSFGRILYINKVNLVYEIRNVTHLPHLD